MQTRPAKIHHVMQFIEVTKSEIFFQITGSTMA